MIQISAAELEVMSVIWAKPRLAASDVHAALGADREWTLRTVKTLLARLVEKGALGTEEDGRRFLYIPLIDQADFKANAAERFIDRVFSGRAAPLIAHLADSRGLSADDIADLENLLRDLKK